MCSSTRLTTIIILVFSVSLCFGLSRDEYHNDRVVVRLAESAGEIDIIDMGNVDFFGVDEIDAVIENKGITRIELEHRLMPGIIGIVELLGFVVMYLLRKTQLPKTENP